MDTRHEILLEQMLEELRAQTTALHDLQGRMERLEKVLSQSSGDAKRSVDPKEG